VKLDVTAGVDMLRDAADGGFADAQFSLGEAFANGRGTRASEFNGKRYLKLAAKQGHAGAIEELKRHFW
jgi:TPR repeat protein